MPGALPRGIGLCHIRDGRRLIRDAVHHSNLRHRARVKRFGPLGDYRESDADDPEEIHREEHLVGDPYDAVVIGAGPAGERAAGRLAGSGLTVAIVERRLVGGECSYWGCIPSKTLIRPGHVLAAARRVPGAAEAVSGHIDAAAAFARGDYMTASWHDDGQLPWLAEKGIELVRGTGQLTGERAVEVRTADGGTRRLSAARAVVLATGTSPLTPPIPGLREAGPWDNQAATSAKELPGRLLVLGGGAVGVKMAQAFRRLGCDDVVVIEGAERLLTHEEPFAGEELRAAFEAEGITVVTNVRMTAARRDGRDRPVIASLDDGRDFTGDEILVAVGRRPATLGIGLDAVGLEPGRPVPVDGQLRAVGVHGGWPMWRPPAAAWGQDEIAATHGGHPGGVAVLVCHPPDLPGTLAGWPPSRPVRWPSASRCRQCHPARMRSHMVLPRGLTGNQDLHADNPHALPLDDERRAHQLMTSYSERRANAGNMAAGADTPRARQVTLPSAPRAAGLARQEVRDALVSWGLGRLEDTAVLLTSELVGNAVRHAHHGGKELELRIADTGASLRIEVSDADPRPPQFHLPAELDESGFGFVLVEALAARWGVDQATAGKTVWIELDTGRCGASRELGALFDQVPIAVVFCDPELRVRRTNAAFRQLLGLPDGALIGRCFSELDGGMDAALVERILVDQVMTKGVPVADVSVTQILADKRRVLLWSADPVMENRQLLGTLCRFRDITGQVPALRQAHALLERAGHQIGTTLDIHRTASELADLAVPGLADRIVVDLLDQVLHGENLPLTGSGTLRFRRVVVRDTSKTRTKVGYKVGDLITAPLTSPALEELSRGKPLLARTRAEISRSPYAPGYVKVLLAHGMHTSMTVPLIARGITLGVAVFWRAENPEPFDVADARLASEIASHAAVCLDNARRYTDEHTTAITLQRSLLPQHIPQVAGLDIAYRYQPASQTVEVGGDWFDVIPLNTGQVALVVGDVTGHSIHAAAIMGQLRTTTAALARLGHPPEEIMSQLSGAVAEHGHETGATCLYALYEQASRRCRLTSAGHLPPALRHPDGTTEFIDTPGGVMLGVGPSRYPATDTKLPPGSVLALYTDGLIEHPGQDITTGMSRLARTLTASPAPSLEHLCDSVLASLGSHARDDIALLLARTTTETAR
jgi:serine phosphatase RsbU (regulator of sigma subunit)/thioredoxin reductase/anti-sigma regulatory factor (Ser/Thr protein kinase)